MKEKCEICGGTDELTEVYACACEKDSTHATICHKCREKYFETAFYGPSISFPNGLSFAEKLVFAYQTRNRVERMTPTCK